MMTKPQKLPSRSIKGIDTREKFLYFQAILTEAADKSKAPRIIFDDVWTGR
jgi:hypothetical protein